MCENFENGGQAGPIYRDRGIDSYPTIFVRVQKEVIRKRLSTANVKTLDAMVRGLLNEQATTLAEDTLPAPSNWIYYDQENAPDEHSYQPGIDGTFWSKGEAPLGFDCDEIEMFPREAQEHLNIAAQKP